MAFQRIAPTEKLKDFIECYWIVTSTDNIPIVQKIIPDGFPELIFHFGDPYQINFSGLWEIQDSSLLAGQITKHFNLQNTGTSDIFGIKLRPAAITRLFNIDMHTITDKVMGLNYVGNKNLLDIDVKIRSVTNHKDRIHVIEKLLIDRLPFTKSETRLEDIIHQMFLSHGMISVKELSENFKISERKLERLFKKYVGLSPKFYCRLIRFAYIFEVVQNKNLSWSEIGVESGFYDQPHFIKNFKTFTGEDPGKYFFEGSTIANFFMKKSRS